MQSLKISYDVFPERWYKQVEKFVLGGLRFNEEQKKFIHHLDSSVIEAGPGSGKTTALAAKVALLLKKIEIDGSIKGVCVITHTNAAVDEILKVLKNLGFNDIPHPHFIGTIHEFFNKYGMFPLLKGLNNKLIDIHFSEETALIRHFKNELSKKHRWLKSKGQSYIRNSNGLLNRLINSHLYFDEGGKLDAKTYQNGSFDKYKEDYLIIKNESWKKGIFHVNDTFCLAQKYFELNNVKRRLRKRFTYLLMDEYQDVSPLAFRLLKELFLVEGNVFQMIGDSNQHIAYGNPEVPTGEFNTYYLNQTNRFGDSVTNVLNNMFNDNLQATKPKKSLQPVLFLYKNPKKLPDCFTRFLNQQNILLSPDQTPILVAARNHSRDLGLQLNKTTQMKSSSSFQRAKNEVYKLLAEKTNLHIKSIVKELQGNFVSYELKINKELMDYYRHNTNYTLIKDSINLFLGVFGSISKVNITNKLFERLERIKETKYSSLTKESSGTSIKTIHDLKGQTVMANMVYLVKGSREEYAFLKNYTTLIERPKYYNDINQRVVFVAMSRVTTLLSVALHEETYNNLVEETRMKLKKDFNIVSENDIEGLYD